jgi:hypothetical protein
VSDEPFLPPPPPPPAPGGPPAGAPLIARVDQRELRTLRSLSTVVVALVSIVAVINLISLPNDLAYVATLQDVGDGDFSGPADILDQEDLRAAFGKILIGGMVLAGIVWVIWQHRARRIAEKLGASGQRHTEPLAVVGWFFPIANVVVPKQVTNDLWRASDPDAPPAMRIDGRPVWSVINVWWGLWLLGGIVGRFLWPAGDLETNDQLDGYITRVRIEIGLTLLTVVSAVLAVLIVRGITARMLERGRRYGVTI